MRITYNVTGDKRKALVGAISQELNTPARYLGMPTTAFEVGGYRIDKTGTLTGPDNRDLVADLQGLHGFVVASEAYDDEHPDIDQHHPGRYADPNEPPTEAMLRHAEAWMEGQPAYEELELTEREELGLGRKRRGNWQGENGMQAGDVPEPADDSCPSESGKDESARLTIEMPLIGFTPEKLDNLTRLVSSKASLLKAALGVDELPIRMTDDKLLFPWFIGKADGAHTQAYAMLVSLLCKTAYTKTRVTAKDKSAEGNPKYAMRCFLLSLGFIGDGYKAARKILLSGLKGNSAFRDGTAKKQEVDDNE